MANLIRPKPQLTFNEYQLTCPFSTKSRCGRRFCIHTIHKQKDNVRCVEYNCPFFGEDSKLLKGKK